MGTGVRIRDLLPAAQLADDDVLAVHQQNAFNPITGQNGDTRRVSVGELVYRPRTSLADMVRGAGHNLLDVLNVTTIPQAMAALRTRCNGTGVPNFAGLEIGDYIDGISLGGIAAPPGGIAPGVWNNTHKNNRIVIAGFNYYKSTGVWSNVITKNHIVFAFDRAIARGRMNSTNSNSGGYAASEIRQWLEGEDGNGSGPFAVGLKNAIGDYLLTIPKNIANSVWLDHTVWIPSEIEVHGRPISGMFMLEGSQRAISPLIQLPLYQKSMELIIKFFNGVRTSWWLSSPTASWSSMFSVIQDNGQVSYEGASYTNYGISPVFCIA